MGKIVYFLGAGASKASSFGLPCMEGFFDTDDFIARDYPNLAEFLGRRFPATDLSNLNIEEVITCLELSLDRVGLFGRNPDWRTMDARREFDRFVAKRLTIPGGVSSDCHELLMGDNIAGGGCEDTVITVNYDLIVDQTLYKLSPRNGNDLADDCTLERMYSLLDEVRLQLYHGRRPSLIRGDSEWGCYLKLHGSLDWLYCSNDACPYHRSFFANWMGSPRVHNRPGELCAVCGAPLMTALVPPTTTKTFAQFPKIGLLWSLAHRELRSADRIVVFGLSFAPSDYYLRWLFRSATTDRTNKPEICNINTDKGVSAEIIRQLTGVRPVACQTVDQYRQWATK
jgi:hypothetical protein